MGDTKMKQTKQTEKGQEDQAQRAGSIHR